MGRTYHHAMDTVALRMLGPLQLCVGGVARDIGGPRRRTVLAYLVLHRGTAVPAERIVADIWGPEAHGGAGRSMQTAISALRRALAHPANDATILRSAGGYRLDLGDAWVDIDRFEVAADRAMRDSDADAAAEALRLWRGAPLQDVPYDDWAAPARNALLETYRGVVRVQLDGLLADRCYEQALGTVGELLAADPFDETLWERRLLALYRSGRQTEALAAFAEVDELLRGELGLEPGPSLADLQRRILLHDPALAGPSAPPHVVPASISSFVGRAAELAQLDGLTQAHRLVTVTGPGGVGKTRLSAELAHGWRGRMPGGVFFVDLSSVAEGCRVLGEVAGQLGIERRTGDVLTHLVGRLQRAPALLVLDNAEHLRESVASLARALLERAPAMRIVVTSRVALGVTGELAWQLLPLDLPRDGDELAELAGRDAVALFVRRAREVRPGFRIGDANAPVVARIVRRLDGLPLAIEIAATRLRSAGVTDIEARLERDLGSLRSDDPTVSERNRTLTAVLAWSTDRLDPATVQAFARLAVTPGGFDLDAATVLCGEDRRRTAEHIDVLVQHSLVTVEPIGDHTRYRMLEVVRDHAMERLAGSGQRASAERALVDWGLALAHGVSRGLRGPDEPRWVERLASEQAALRAALAAGLAHAPADGLRLATQLVRFWWANAGDTDAVGQRSVPTVHEGIDWLERFLGVLPADEHDRVRAGGQIALGFLRGVIGDHGGARDVLVEARDAMMALGHDRLAGLASLYLASAAWGAGWAEVDAHFQAAEVSLSRADDREGQAALALLEYAYRLRSQGPDVAAAARERFLLHTADVRNHTVLTYRSGVVALDALARGNADAAVEPLQGAIETNRNATDPATTAILLGICAWHAALAGDTATAVLLVVMAEEVEARHGLGFRQAGFTREFTREALGRRLTSELERQARREAADLAVHEALDRWRGSSTQRPARRLGPAR